jgi:predicted amidophosphoribosyltransferase
MAKLTSEREMECPCCGAVLTVDLNLGRIVSHEAPLNPNRPELDNAQTILAEQAARRDALFQQSFENEKNKGDALSKRFEEALKEAKKEPVSRPLRGFDLD